MRRSTVFLAVLFLLASGLAQAEIPAVVSGRVFYDPNGTGKAEGAKPLAGIRVTDGVNIVTTGPDGSYTVPIGDDPTTPQKGSRVVAINWPSGKWPTAPWWARLDKITDAKNVNFFLRDDEQPLPFAFFHVSDDHSAGFAYNSFGPPAAKLKPMARFLINTGDMGDCAVVRANAQKFPMPVMSVPGNHDIVGGHGPERFKPEPLAGNGGYTNSLGPVRWSFDYAGVHFVGLDWMDPFIPEEVNGNVPQVAADWLEKDLQLVKPGTRTFVFVHFPTGCQKYYDTISKHKVAHVFGGHNHQHRFYNFAGIPAVTAINFMAGGNLIIVQQDDFTLGEFCLGYKGPDHHIKRCSLARKGAVLGSFGPRRLPGKMLTDQRLGGGASVDLGHAKGVQVALTLEPRAATKTGFRIGSGAKAVEVSWSGREMNIAGVPVPFGWEDYDKKTLLWDVVLDGERLEFYCNKRYHLSKPLTVNLTGPITFFAEGGEATLKKAEVWGLKAK